MQTFWNVARGGRVGWREGLADVSLGTDGHPHLGFRRHGQVEPAGAPGIPNPNLTPGLLLGMPDPPAGLGLREIGAGRRPDPQLVVRGRCEAEAHTVLQRLGRGLEVAFETRVQAGLAMEGAVLQVKPHREANLPVRRKIGRGTLGGRPGPPELHLVPIREHGGLEMDFHPAPIACAGDKDPAGRRPPPEAHQVPTVQIRGEPVRIHPGPHPLHQHLALRRRRGMQVRRQETVVLRDDGAEIPVESRHASAPIGEQGQTPASRFRRHRTFRKEREMGPKDLTAWGMTVQLQGGVALPGRAGWHRRDEAPVHRHTAQIQIGLARHRQGGVEPGGVAQQQPMVRRHQAHPPDVLGVPEGHPGEV